MWFLFFVCWFWVFFVCLEVKIDAPWGQETLLTYGGELLEPNRYAYADFELRALVAKCLSHRPSSRPGLAWLQERIRQRLGKGFTETDQQTLRWSLGFFGGPPPPSGELAGDEWVQL